MGTEQENREDHEVMVQDVTPLPPTALDDDQHADEHDDDEGDEQGARDGGFHGTDPTWQRIQASFIDDPRASVVQAADLVEKTAQSFVATIQERERSLRGTWERDSTSADTELLRTTLRDYRALYEQISQI